MKKIALISTFCDTKEKQKILKDILIKLKTLGVDTMVLSPIPLSQDTISISDFFFFTKENPILKWPERANTFWWKNKNKYGKELIFHKDIDDYGWAALYQTKKLSELALTYDYDIFYHMIYDTEISKELENDILENKVNITYHRINPNDSSNQWNVTLHFLSFDRKNLEFFTSKINKETYLVNNGFAEEFAESIINQMNMTPSEFPVKDLVRYVDISEQAFTYSKSLNYNIFFSNYLNEFSFVVYDIKEGNLQVFINDEEIFDIEDFIIKKFIKTDIKSFKVSFNEDSIEYIDIINSIPRNSIEYI